MDVLSSWAARRHVEQSDLCPPGKLGRCMHAVAASFCCLAPAHPVASLRAAFPTHVGVRCSTSPVLLAHSTTVAVSPRTTSAIGAGSTRPSLPSGSSYGVPASSMAPRGRTARSSTSWLAGCRSRGWGPTIATTIGRRGRSGARERIKMATRKSTGRPVQTASIGRTRAHAVGALAQHLLHVRTSWHADPPLSAPLPSTPASRPRRDVKDFRYKMKSYM